MPETKPPRSRANQYTDIIGGFSNRELQTATWYVRHKIFLQRLLVGGLAVVGILSLAISLIGWGDYLFRGMSQDTTNLALQTQSFPNYAAQHDTTGASRLVPGSTLIFASGPDSYDFSATIKNPNLRWSALVTYHFVFANGTTTLQSLPVLPGETRPLSALGQKLSGYPTNAALAIDHINWQHLDNHHIPNVPNYLSERLQFAVTNFAFSRANGTDALPAHQIVFDLTNASAYAYWEPAFDIELLNRAEPVGMLYVTVDRFGAGETRHIELRSLQPDLVVTDIAIYPRLNIFDPAIFMPPAV